MAANRTCSYACCSCAHGKGRVCDVGGRQRECWRRKTMRLTVAACGGEPNNSMKPECEAVVDAA